MKCSKQIFNQTFNKTDDECGLYTFECDGDNGYINLGLYYDVFTNDDECTSRQANLPTVIGCFCSNSTFSFETSCRNHRLGTVATYSDGVCGEEDAVMDLVIAIYSQERIKE